MTRKDTFRTLMATLAAAVLLSGCLKTRAQLKGDDDSIPAPQQVQDVRPQGQYVMDEMKQEITRLTGRIEDLERRAAGSESAQADQAREELVKRMEARVTELERAQAAMIEELKKLQSAPAAAAASEDLMDKARDAIKAKNWDAAVETLGAVLKNPKSRDAEEASFLRGEAHFELKQYKKAIIDFSKFPEKYSKSKRMPAALLRIGQSFEALGMKEDAKGFYAELADKYPGSPEGKRAKSKLK